MCTKINKWTNMRKYNRLSCARAAVLSDQDCNGTVHAMTYDRLTDINSEFMCFYFQSAVKAADKIFILTKFCLVFAHVSFMKKVQDGGSKMLIVKQ